MVLLTDKNHYHSLQVCHYQLTCQKAQPIRIQQCLDCPQSPTWCGGQLKTAYKVPSSIYSSSGSKFIKLI